MCVCMCMSMHAHVHVYVYASVSSAEDLEDLEHAIQLPKYEKKMNDYIHKMRETLTTLRVGRAVPNIVSERGDACLRHYL